MEYLGIEIDDYFALTDAQKTVVHNNVGRNSVSTDRTFEEIIEEIHSFTAEVK